MTFDELKKTINKIFLDVDSDLFLNEINNCEFEVETFNNFLRDNGGEYFKSLNDALRCLYAKLEIQTNKELFECSDFIREQSIQLNMHCRENYSILHLSRINESEFYLSLNVDFIYMAYNEVVGVYYENDCLSNDVHIILKYSNFYVNVYNYLERINKKGFNQASSLRSLSEARRAMLKHRPNAIKIF